MVAHFGRGFKAGEPAFTGVDVERCDDLAPILSEALACLHCRVVDRTRRAIITCSSRRSSPAAC